MSTFTDRDMREQVATSLGADASDHTVPAIVDELQANFGTVPIDDIPDADYWSTVRRHHVWSTPR